MTTQHMEWGQRKEMAKQDHAAALDFYKRQFS